MEFSGFVSSITNGTITTVVNGTDMKVDDEPSSKKQRISEDSVDRFKEINDKVNLVLLDNQRLRDELESNRVEMKGLRDMFKQSFAMHRALPIVVLEKLKEADEKHKEADENLLNLNTRLNARCKKYDEENS